MNIFQHLTISCLIVFSTHNVTDLHQNDSEVIRPDWHCVMSGQEVKFCFQIRASSIRTETLASWTLRIRHRTLARGTAQRNGQEIAVQFVVPKTKGDVILDAKLELTLGDQVIEHEVFVFPKNPFEHKTKFLKNARIYLYDPVGETEEVFEQFDIPHELLHDQAAIENLPDGIVVVGEGLDPDSHSNLPSVICEAASRGINVIWLAPKAGRFVFKMDDPVLTNLSMGAESEILRFDRRFDARNWNGVSCVETTFLINQENAVVELTSQIHHRGWSWIKIQSNERFVQEPDIVICGHRIVQHWERSAVARHLLWHLFDELVPSN